jgi:D-alanyl-D-alanine dipeptidase
VHLYLIGAPINSHRKKTFKETHLVELIKLDSTIKLDIRYATKNNFVGQPV